MSTTDVIVVADTDVVITQELSDPDVIEVAPNDDPVVIESAEQGPPGPPTMFYGEGSPDDSLGGNGAFYIDTTAHVLYGPKNGGTWPAGTSLVGPPGQDGANGADGADGTDGVDGANGQGVPAGGTTGHLLAKKTAADYDTQWIAPPAVVAGSDKQVQFNDGGSLAGNANFTWDKTTNTLTVGPSAGRLNVAGCLAVNSFFDTILWNGAKFGWSASSGVSPATTNFDLILARGGPGILEQRNGTNAQTFRLANTWTSATDNEFLEAAWVSNAAWMRTRAAGTGTKRNFIFSGNTIYFATGSSSDTLRWRFDNSAGHMLAETNNASDIGASAGSQPRSIFVGTSVVGGYHRPGSFTVATLPSASTAGAGALATATDLSSLTNGSTATGGGSSKGIVKSDGSNWIVLG